MAAEHGLALAQKQHYFAGWLLWLVFLGFAQLLGYHFLRHYPRHLRIILALSTHLRS